jgi:diguanylate cyclase (GGDEF)-like protein
MTGVVAIAAAVAGVAWEAATRPAASLVPLVFFAALAAIAALLRPEPRSPGFDAAPAFAAILLFHDPGIALAAVFLGSAAPELRRRPRLRSLQAPAELALATWIVALLYCSAVARDAPLMAKVSGYILLVVGFLVVRVLSAWLRTLLLKREKSFDVRGALLGEGRMLVVITPLVAAEVAGFAAMGLAGVAVGFLPALVISYALRERAETARRNAELRHRNRELSILTESATKILSAEGDEETLRRMVALLGQLAPTKACAIVTWTPAAEIAATVYRFGDCLATDQEILRWVEGAGFAQSAPSRAFVFQNEQRRFRLSQGVAIQVLIGIQTAEVIYGVLAYETEERSILSGGSLNLLTLLVSQTALAMQDQLLRREMGEKTTLLERQAARQARILDVANALIGTFDADAMLERIAVAAREALGFDAVLFALYEPKRDEYIRRVHAGLDDVWEDLRKRSVPREEIAAYFRDDLRIGASSAFFIAGEWPSKHRIVVPLTAGDDPIGYLAVFEPHDHGVPSIETIQTLEIFALQAVTAIRSARQYEEIRRLTFIDALTPAYNHRYFQEALARELHRHDRSGHELTLAMLDIDDFKRINDTFGHPVGDEILKGIVDELMKNARESDVVARYGGEEFAIIFPDTAAASARDAANRMRDLVARREFAMPQIGRALRVTVSVGVAVWPHDGVTATDLIARADAALYFAKKNGKNRVALAADLDASGEARA